MKQITKMLFLLSAAVSAGAAEARLIFEPFAGVDCYHAWSEPKGLYQDIFNKSNPGAAGYLGAKFHRFLGLEIGYINTNRKRTIAPNSALFLPGTTITGTVKQIREEGYIDLDIFVPVGIPCLELFGSVGYGIVKPKIFTDFTAPNTGIGAGPSINLINSLTVKAKGVFRTGLGLRYMATDRVGVRGKFGWEGTSGLQIENPAAVTAAGLSDKPFKNSWTINLGVFLTL